LILYAYIGIVYIKISIIFKTSDSRFRIGLNYQKNIDNYKSIDLDLNKIVQTKKFNKDNIATVFE